MVNIFNLFPKKSNVAAESSYLFVMSLFLHLIMESSIKSIKQYLYQNPNNMNFKSIWGALVFGLSQI